MPEEKLGDAAVDDEVTCKFCCPQRHMQDLHHCGDTSTKHDDIIIVVVIDGVDVLLNERKQFQPSISHCEKVVPSFPTQ